MGFQSGEWAEVPSVPRPQQQVQVDKKLSVVLPFIESEMEMVRNLLQTSHNLCGQIPRICFLVPFKGLKIDEIMTAAKQAFSEVGVIQDSEGVMSDWQQGQPMRSAAGPNSLFRQAAWFFYLQKRFAAWLWLEPDCTPITDRWFFELEREYFEAGRPFLGVKMRIGQETEYMNGVGIYPWNAIQYAPLLVQSAMWKQHPEMEIGFDVAGGKDVLLKAHLTRKIQLELKKTQIVIRPDTVLLHGRLPSESKTPVNLEEYGTQRDAAAAVASVGGGSVALESSLQENLSGGVESRHAVYRRESSYSTDLSEPEDRESASTSRPSSHPVEQLQGNSGSSAPPAQNLLVIDTPHGKKLIPQSKNDSSDYGRISKDIKKLVWDLVSVWNGQPHRKVLIVKELRNAKLVPKHFR